MASISNKSAVLYEFGPFRLDFSEKTLARDGVPVALPPKAFETLAVLVRRHGHLVEKEDLLREVWAGSFVEESNLAQNVYLLRKALGEGAGEVRYIETVPRRGYRFVAGVREIPSGEEASADASQSRAESHAVIAPVSDPPREESRTAMSGAAREEEVGHLSQAISAAVSEDRPPRPRRSRKLWLVAGLAACLVPVAFYLWLSRASRRLGADAGEIKTIAVLPFKQFGAATEDELLGLGMADATIIKLGAVPGVSVLPVSAVVGYTGRERDPLRAGRELGVDAVLDGTVQRAEGRVRVTTQLIRLHDGKTEWAAKFDERYTDIFALQDSISEQLAAALSNEYAARTKGKRYTNDTEAYQSYLMGLYFWNERSKENLSKAVGYFQRAIERDPAYAPAHAGLADCYALIASNGHDTLPRQAAYERAKTAATRAIELDATLAEAHTALALVQINLDRDRAKADESYRRAIALNPNYATAHMRYAWHLLWLGRLDDALRSMKRAQELDPLSKTHNTALGYLHSLANQPDEAIRYHRRALELDPKFTSALLNLGDAYEQKGMYAEAVAEFEKADELEAESAYALESIARVRALMGEKEEARRLLAEILRAEGKKEVSYYNIALVHAALGESEQAAAWLEKELAHGALQRTLLRYDPRLDSFRSDARYGEFLHRHNLTQIASQP